MAFGRLNTLATDTFYLAAAEQTHCIRLFVKRLILVRVSSYPKSVPTRRDGFIGIGPCIMTGKLNLNRLFEAFSHFAGRLGRLLCYSPSA